MPPCSASGATELRLGGATCFSFSPDVCDRSILHRRSSAMWHAQCSTTYSRAVWTTRSMSAAVLADGELRHL